MNIADVLQSRYTTKQFDANKKISDSDFEKIKQALRMSPSSLNLQPWHFIIADDEAGKARIAKATQGMFAMNQSKVTGASHVVVYCAKLDMDDAYAKKILEQENSDGRFQTDTQKEQRAGVIQGYLDMHAKLDTDIAHWLALQVYLNMGAVLVSAGALGIDATPMEGVDVDVLNEEFGLLKKGYTALAVVSFGYRAEDDVNDPSRTPKSRLPESDVFTKA